VLEREKPALKLAPAAADCTHAAGGVFTLSSPMPLGPYPSTICSYLHHWNNLAPERICVAERDADGGWDAWSYAVLLREVRAIAAGMLVRGLVPGDRVMLLSENSVAHLQLQLACMYVGIIAVPVSPAYALMSRDFARLRYIHDLVEPALIFVADADRFSAAIRALDGRRCDVVATRVEEGLIPFAELRQFNPDRDSLQAAYSAVGRETWAKILFTSGSTGVPKGVINTQRMLCANQQAIAQVWPFIEARPPVLLDWLPWNHTFGGNHNIGLVLRNGGTLYIDGGRPTPEGIEATVRNLREVSPTIYFNVPRGYAMLLPFLETDPGLRDRFFAELDLLFYSGAALPHDLWNRLDRLARASRGSSVAMTSAWGATETAPAATVAHFPLSAPGNIGLPVPGTEVRFIPSGDKLEMRVRGPQVTPGYFRRDDLSREAFDADGFYRIGDAGRLADPDEPAAGILFDGRIAEEFKLSTGTWVSAGKIRLAAIDATAPLIQDAAVTGHDRDEIGLLVFPNLAACCTLAGLAAGTAPGEIIADGSLRQAFAQRFAAYNAVNPASSTRIARVILLVEPPSIDANEITDKGYVNQRAVLERRAELVARLYTDHPDVIGCA
jgi:feruloyl-CoA synthase